MNHKSYWHTTTIHREVAANTKVTWNEDNEATVTYRHPLPKDAEAGADREAAPMCAEFEGIGPHELRLLALELWWASFPGERIPLKPGTEDFAHMHAVQARNALASRLLDGAEEIVRQPLYEDSALGDPVDSYVGRTLEIVKNMIGNLHLGNFVEAMGTYRTSIKHDEDQS